MQMHPSLNCNGNCEAAFTFYEQCLGGKIVMRLTHGNAPAEAERLLRALAETGMRCGGAQQGGNAALGCLGAQPRPHEPLHDDQLAFCDTLATLTREPDAALEALRTLYAGDERVRVQATVLNAVLNRAESIVGL